MNIASLRKYRYIIGIGAPVIGILIAIILPIFKENSTLTLKFISEEIEIFIGINDRKTDSEKDPILPSVPSGPMFNGTTWRPIGKSWVLMKSDSGKEAFKDIDLTRTGVFDPGALRDLLPTADHCQKVGDALMGNNQFQALIRQHNLGGLEIQFWVQENDQPSICRLKNQNWKLVDARTAVGQMAYIVKYGE